MIIRTALHHSSTFVGVACRYWRMRVRAHRDVWRKRKSVGTPPSASTLERGLPPAARLRGGER